MVSSLKSRLARRRPKERRSPLKWKLRLPGQSVDEEIERLMRDKAESYAIAAGALLGMAAFEWSHVLLDARPMPHLLTAVAVGVTAYAIYRLLPLRQRIRNLKLGRDGERVFGQFLEEELRLHGHSVIHDIVGGNWNIDHVVVGQRGIYTVETKTRSVPHRRPPVVRYDGKSLTVDGWQPDRNPINQAKAQANWLRETLSRSLGINLPVRAIVAFPGWHVEARDDAAARDVHVLSGRDVPAFIQETPQSVDEKTVEKVRRFLRQMVRTD